MIYPASNLNDPNVAICDIHAAPALWMALWAPSADFEPKRRACWEIWPGKGERKKLTPAHHEFGCSAKRPVWTAKPLGYIIYSRKI